MQIDLIGSDTIKITMNKTDMLCYDFDFETLDCDSPEMKNFIVRLLRIIKEKKKIDLDSKKLYIEAFPKNDGGCMIYISPMEEAQNTNHNYSAYTGIVCKFENIEKIIDLSKYLHKNQNHIIHSSSLYKQNTDYNLVIEVFSKLEAKIINAANEFGDDIRKDNVYCAYIKEHNSCIINKNAVDILAKL